MLGPGLRDLADRHPVIGEVRGLGVFWALDLVSDRATRAMLPPYGASSPAMNELVAESKKRGLLPFTNYNRHARGAAVHGLGHRGQGRPGHPRRGVLGGGQALRG